MQTRKFHMPALNYDLQVSFCIKKKKSILHIVILRATGTGTWSCICCCVKREAESCLWRDGQENSSLRELAPRYLHPKLGTLFSPTSHQAEDFLEEQYPKSNSITPTHG